MNILLLPQQKPALRRTRASAETLLMRDRRKGAGLPGGQFISASSKQSIVPDSFVACLCCFYSGGKKRRLLFWRVTEREVVAAHSDVKMRRSYATCVKVGRSAIPWGWRQPCSPHMVSEAPPTHTDISENVVFSPVHTKTPVWCHWEQLSEKWSNVFMWTREALCTPSECVSCVLEMCYDSIDHACWPGCYVLFDKAVCRLIFANWDRICLICTAPESAAPTLQTVRFRFSPREHAVFKFNIKHQFHSPVIFFVLEPLAMLVFCRFLLLDTQLWTLFSKFDRPGYDTLSPPTGLECLCELIQIAFDVFVCEEIKPLFKK